MQTPIAAVMTARLAVGAAHQREAAIQSSKPGQQKWGECSALGSLRDLANQSESLFHKEKSSCPSLFRILVITPESLLQDGLFQNAKARRMLLMSLRYQHINRIIDGFPSTPRTASAS